MKRTLIFGLIFAMLAGPVVNVPQAEAARRRAVKKPARVAPKKAVKKVASKVVNTVVEKSNDAINQATDLMADIDFTPDEQFKQAVLEEAYQVAQDEIRLVNKLTEISAILNDPAIKDYFVEEVFAPAVRGETSLGSVRRFLDDLFGYDVARDMGAATVGDDEVEDPHVPWCMTIGVGGDYGVGNWGAQGGATIAMGLDDDALCANVGFTYGIVMGGSVEIQIGLWHRHPQDLFGGYVGVEGGYNAGIGADLGVYFDYDLYSEGPGHGEKWQGIVVAPGAGAELQVNLATGHTWVLYAETNRDDGWEVTFVLEGALNRHEYTSEGEYSPNRELIDLWLDYVMSP